MSKRRASKVALTVALALVMVLTSVQMAFACTSMYFGSDTTENGSTFIGRSEDSSWSFYKKFYTVREAADHAEGEMYQSNGYSFSVPYPAHTYRYTMVKDVSNYAPDPKTMEEMAQAGINEKGVAVTSSVSLSGGQSVITGRNGVDPMAGDAGLHEEDIPSVVLMQAATAREGAEVLIDIYENNGAGGRDMTAIMDSKEVWVVQSLAGHVAIANRLPSDMVGTTPNITFNIEPGSSKDTIATSNLISVAEQAGTLVRDLNGKVKVADSYANKPGSYSNRLYNCYLYLRGEAYADKWKAGYINYLHEPRAEKYSTFEVLRSLCFRGEGGKHYADSSTGNSIGIGNDNNLETHMFESRKDMPAELSVVQWEALGPAEFGCYLPGYNALITSTIPENGIGLDTMTYNYEHPELNSYRAAYFELYFLCKGKGNQDNLSVGTLAARTKYGEKVKEFWEAYQKELIAKQPEIDKDMLRILAYDKDLAEKKATALNKHLQRECLGYILTMVNELHTFLQSPQEGQYEPSCMGKLPTYSFDAIGGTGLPTESVEEMIAALPAADAITTADKDAIAAAKAAYDALPEDQKALVPADVVEKLNAAEESYEKAAAEESGNVKPEKPAKPAKVAIKAAKPGKKQITVTWKKVAKNATGYQIQIKPSKGKAKVVTIKKAATVKKVVKKLKKGTYKVKVRAFNKANGQTVYGAWSKTLKAKVKK